MIYHDVIPYSPEYWQLKLGVPSASNFSRIMQTKRKVKDPTQKLRNYVAELIAQRLHPSPTFFTEREGHTQAQRNGTALEPEARKWFELEIGNELKVCNGGWITTDDGHFGASPDGLIINDSGSWIGGLELKCPEAKTHVAWTLEGILPAKHAHQVHGGLAVSEGALPVWWFMSYCVGYDPFIIRVEPNEFTQKIREAMKAFDLLFQAAWQQFTPLPQISVDTPSVAG